MLGATTKHHPCGGAQGRSQAAWLLLWAFFRCHRPLRRQGLHGPRLQWWPCRPALPAACGSSGSRRAADVHLAPHRSLGVSVSGGNPPIAADTWGVKGLTWMLLLCWAKETRKSQCWGYRELLDWCLQGPIVSHPPGHGWAEQEVAPAPAAAELHPPRCAAPCAG